jgi:integrase
MATITERVNKAGETVYLVRIRKRGQTHTTTFKRKTDVKRWIRSIESAIDEHRHFPSKESLNHTLAEAITRYQDEVLIQLSTSEIKNRTQQLGYWSEQLGRLTLADVTPDLIAEQRNRLSKEGTHLKCKRAPATVNRYLAALSAVLTYAKRELGWLDASPIDRVAKLKEPRGRVRFLDDDERERLLAVCKQSSNGDLYLAVVLCLSTGARQDEIMSLRWPDVDLQRSMIVIHDTKNGERRSVPLLGFARELLRERNKVRRIDTDLLFPGKVHPQNPIDLRKPWTIALKAAEIQDFRWHDLRHSAASYLAMSGATPSELAAVLGHKTLAMVKHYAHLSEQHTVSVIERMNRAIFDE